MSDSYSAAYLAAFDRLSSMTEEERAFLVCDLVRDLRDRGRADLVRYVCGVANGVVRSSVVEGL